MHELSRLEYLQALDIQGYISRAQLPGAAETQRLAIARVVDRDSVAVLKHSPPPLGSLANGLAPESAQGRVSPGPKPGARSDAGQQALSHPASRFSLAAIVAGGWLWLEELSDSVLATQQVQLVQAMAHALGRTDIDQGRREPGPERPEVTQFNWPIHTNRQLDIGPEAARSSVAGFIQRKLDQRACHGLVLLGEACATRVPVDQFSGLRLCCTASTASMLRDPQLKRQVWRDLQTLASSP
jgi:hypothetical protein